jgi:1,4-dihydroxy-2-naphthoate octaprenyltransferase
MSLKGWWLASRPKTLTAALVPVMVGTALVYAMDYEVQWSLSIWALLGALFIQLATNFINDAMDFRKGADTEERIGPQRVTQSGVMTEKRVMGLAYVCFLLAILCGVPLVMAGGWVLVAIGLVSLLCAYAYTGGPYPLAYKGLGDVFVILFFGLVAVGGVFFLHTETYSWEAFVAGLQVGLLATVLLAVNNLRDVNQDRRVDKRTLAVRFGSRFARWQIAFLLLLTFALESFWALKGYTWTGVLPWLTLPLAFGLVRGVFNTEPSPVFNKFLARAAMIHLVFGFALSVGFFTS